MVGFGPQGLSHTRLEYWDCAWLWPQWDDKEYPNTSSASGLVTEEHPGTLSYPETSQHASHPENIRLRLSLQGLEVLWFRENSIQLLPVWQTASLPCKHLHAGQTRKITKHFATIMGIFATEIIPQDHADVVSLHPIVDFPHKQTIWGVHTHIHLSLAKPLCKMVSSCKKSPF